MTADPDRDRLMGHDRVFARPRGVLWRRCPDGVIVLAEGMDEPVTLTSPGDVIWELLSAPTELGQLIAELKSRFDATAEQIEADTTGFLVDAIAVGAVEAR